MRQPRLTLGKAALLMVGLGSGALMGVPGFGRAPALRGAVLGSVRDVDGSPAARVEVSLFDDTTLSLVEVTRSDRLGRFAFHQEPARYHVFAAPEGRSDAVGTWALDRVRDRAGGVALKLRAGRPLTVRVRDDQGHAVAGAEVRVVDAGAEPVAVQRRLANTVGRADVVVPARAHLGVFPPQGGAPRWVLAGELGRATELTVTLPAATERTGQVLDDGGDPLAGVIVSAWDADGEHWLGWTQTDGDGAFAIAAPEPGALLRVVDPRQRGLGTEVRVPAGSREPLRVCLPSGRPRAVHARQEEPGERARLWAWSEETGTWSWGLVTDADGHATPRVSEHHAVVAVPLPVAGAPEGAGAGSPAPMEAWDQVGTESPLQLER